MPFIPRRGRPGLLGLAARTAVVAGTATAVSGGIVAHQRRKAYAEEEEAQYIAAQQQVAPPAVAPASVPSLDLVSELQRLGDLRAQGVLDDAEFQAAKARLLS